MFQTTNQLWSCSISRSRYIKIHQVSQMYPIVSDSMAVCFNQAIVPICSNHSQSHQSLSLSNPLKRMWSKWGSNPWKGASSSPLSQKKGHGLWQPAWHLLKCLQSQDWVKTLVKICENIDNIIWKIQRHHSWPRLLAFFFSSAVMAAPLDPQELPLLKASQRNTTSLLPIPCSQAPNRLRKKTRDCHFCYPSISFPIFRHLQDPNPTLAASLATLLGAVPGCIKIAKCFPTPRSATSPVFGSSTWSRKSGLQKRPKPFKLGETTKRITSKKVPGLGKRWLPGRLSNHRPSIDVTSQPNELNAPCWAAQSDPSSQTAPEAYKMPYKAAKVCQERKKSWDVCFKCA